MLNLLTRRLTSSQRSSEGAESLRTDVLTALFGSRPAEPENLQDVTLTGLWLQEDLDHQVSR